VCGRAVNSVICVSTAFDSSDSIMVSLVTFGSMLHARERQFLTALLFL